MRPCGRRGSRSRAVDQVDDVEEAAAGAVADERAGNGDGQVGLAGAGAADQHDVALIGEEVAGRRGPTSVSLIGVPVKSKSSMSLASGSLAIVIWYLMERACFSAISACSRSPTMRSAARAGA
jgi:hypothetical protein